jgi:hypothetical protein
MHLAEVEIKDGSRLNIAALEVPVSPVLWRGIGSDWPCTKNWTLPELQVRLSGNRIPVRVTDNETDVFFNLRAEEPSIDRSMLFENYIELIQQTSCSDRDRPAYAGNISIRDNSVSHWAVELLKECPLPDFFPEFPQDECRLWIGAAGQKSTIHNDPFGNLNAQIIGKKKVLIFEPAQHECLYPEFIHQWLWASRIDPQSVDIEQFPRFADARGFVGELLPGDVLFIPKFWWHFLSTTETSLNINRWIYFEEERKQYWHEQPAATKFIDYDDLLSLLESRFESLNSEDKEGYRERVEILRSGMLRLAAEKKGRANGIHSG